MTSRRYTGHRGKICLCDAAQKSADMWRRKRKRGLLMDSLAFQGEWELSY